MEYQRTIAQPVSLEGEGIFTSKKIKIEFHPLQENEGIIFERADLPRSPQIPLHIDYVVGSEGSTLLSDGKITINLVEHLLSALHGLGIDNLLIRVYGEEIPLFDGSALYFVRKIREAGFRILPALRRKYRLLKPFTMENGQGRITFFPSRTLIIKAKIEFSHPLIGLQECIYRHHPFEYLREISFARTFGFKNLLEERKRKGILKGGSLSNAIVLDEERVLNPEGLRSKDEFVRHKVLDLMGDLYTLGLSLMAEVHAEFSGHRLHIEALKSLYHAGLLEEVEERALTFLWIPKKRKLFF
ncbi:MAG: UDP-3-O-acyl-N-acetylglucosamine deacetylase [Caldimicrobium sp.]